MCYKFLLGRRIGFKHYSRIGAQNIILTAISLQRHNSLHGTVPVAMQISKKNICTGLKGKAMPFPGV